VEHWDYSAVPTDPVAGTRCSHGSLSDDLVTVVVPARNEEATIAACLGSVIDQTWRSLHIVVVDGASSDATADIVRRFTRIDPRVEYLYNPHALIPASLNMALAGARGRWLVRIDAHARIPKDYVETAVGLLRTGKWGGVGGRKNGVGETPAGRAIAAAMASRFGVGHSTYHYGERPQPVDHVPFGCYPVELLRTLGGWDEAAQANEDFELDYRLRLVGKELLFDPRLVINWQCRQHVPDLFRQYRRYGFSKVYVALKHPRSVRLRHLAAPALVATLATAAAAAPRRPVLAAVLAGPYLAALATCTAKTARHLPDRRSRRWVAPAFAAMHLGWGLGFWAALPQELGHWILKAAPKLDGRMPGTGSHHAGGSDHHVGTTAAIRACGDR
jgi:succinoglycan biosynthesis protein ExoA